MKIRKPYRIFPLVFLLFSCGGGSDPVAVSTDYESAESFVQESGFVGSILVKKQNVYILQNGFGFADKARGVENTKNTKFRIASLTKAFTALAVVQLKNTKLIASYDDPLSDYLPDFPNGNIITIRHLLNHRSGLPDYVSLVDTQQPHTPVELVAAFSNKPLDFEPGTQFRYSNSNYTLLGYLIQQISGIEYFDFISSNILMPLGMHNTEYGNSELTGDDYALGYTDGQQLTLSNYVDMSVPFAAGALSSSIKDFELWGESFEALTLVADSDLQDIFSDGDYGFGWIVTQVSGKRAYVHTGGIEGFATLVLIFPDNQGLIVALSNTESAASAMHQIVDAIAENEF